MQNWLLKKNQVWCGLVSMLPEQEWQDHVGLTRWVISFSLPIRVTSSRSVMLCRNPSCWAGSSNSSTLWNNGIHRFPRWLNPAWVPLNVQDWNGSHPYQTISLNGPCISASHLQGVLIKMVDIWVLNRHWIKCWEVGCGIATSFWWLSMLKCIASGFDILSSRIWSHRLFNSIPCSLVTALNTSVLHGISNRQINSFRYVMFIQVFTYWPLLLAPCFCTEKITRGPGVSC